MCFILEPPAAPAVTPVAAALFIKMLSDLTFALISDHIRSSTEGEGRKKHQRHTDGGEKSCSVSKSEDDKKNEPGNWRTEKRFFLTVILLG